MNIWWSYILSSGETLSPEPVGLLMVVQFSIFTFGGVIVPGVLLSSEPVGVTMGVSVVASTQYLHLVVL